MDQGDEIIAYHFRKMVGPEFAGSTQSMRENKLVLNKAYVVISVYMPANSLLLRTAS